MSEAVVHQFCCTLVLYPNYTATLKRDLSDASQALIDHMIERNFARVGRELCGPLGIPTGERCITLTHKGRAFAESPPPPRDTSTPGDEDG